MSEFITLLICKYNLLSLLKKVVSYLRDCILTEVSGKSEEKSTSFLIIVGGIFIFFHNFTFNLTLLLSLLHFILLLSYDLIKFLTSNHELVYAFSFILVSFINLLPNNYFNCCPGLFSKYQDYIIKFTGIRI